MHTPHTNDSEGWLGALFHSLFSGSSWDEKLLQDVCASLAEELNLSPDAPGGMVEFRRTLTLSFFFKFYLTVLQKLNKEDLKDVSVGPGPGTLSAALLPGASGSWSELESAVDQVANLILSSGHLRAEEQGPEPSPRSHMEMGALG